MAAGGDAAVVIGVADTAYTTTHCWLGKPPTPPPLGTRLHVVSEGFEPVAKSALLDERHLDDRA
jgi:hypothetical protein